MQQLNMVESEAIELGNTEIETSLEKKQNVEKKSSLAKIVYTILSFLSFFMLIFMLSRGDAKPSQSMIKLEQVNKVLIYNTILFEDNNLSKLQNTIYKDLRKQKENVNYLIANPDLLVIDFNTKEFQGNGLKIGSDSTIDISYENNKKIINYNNFSEEGRSIILKQIDKNNYPKINIRAIEHKNQDDTYNINMVIDNVPDIQKTY